MESKTSAPSITSRLLTLSVHDPLSFDGVEIAINPELFSLLNLQGGNVGRHTRESSFSSTTSAGIPPVAAGAVGRHSREHSYASAPGSIGVPVIHHMPQHSPVPTSISNISALSQKLGKVNNDEVDDGSYSHPYDVLEEGDIIEIRVWDVKPPSNNNVSSNIENDVEAAIAAASQMVMKNSSRMIQQSQHFVQTATLPLPPASLLHPLNAQGGEIKRAQPDKMAHQSTSTSMSRPPIPPHHRSHNSGPSTNTSVSVTPSFSPSNRQKPSTLNRSDASKDFSHGYKQPQEKQQNISTIDNIHQPNVEQSTSSETKVAQTSNASNVIPPNFFPAVATPNVSLNESTSATAATVTSNSATTGTTLHGTIESTTVKKELKAPPDVLDIIAAGHDLRLKIVMKVTEKSLKALKSNSRTQISLLRQVADLYNLSSYEKVTVTRVTKTERSKIIEPVQADFVTVTIKDQFISRGEMYQFSKFFIGHWIYAGQRLVTNNGMRGNVMQMRRGNQECKYSFVSDDTKITFRSRSCRIIWLVQMSSEMWDYASPYEAARSKEATLSGIDGVCELYHDKFVSFMYRLFEKWNDLEVTHSLTIIFFSRTFITSSKAGDDTDDFIKSANESQYCAFEKDDEGRVYEDHFKVVVENETRPDWESLVSSVKRAFISYPKEVGWNLSSNWCRIPSTAVQGNILEAINTTLNKFQRHYMDRDLHRSGNSVVIISAGSGVFEVDKGLAEITKQRMMDNGIGSDMLSLGLPPLHVAPFFLYKNVSDMPESKTNRIDDWKAYFDVPHWMHLSFISYDNVPKDKTNVGISSDHEVHTAQTFLNTNSFLVRGKTYHKHPTQTASNQGQRHFEDILEACRPRNRGETIRGLPSALVHQLIIIDKVHMTSEGSKFEEDAAHFNKNEFELSCDKSMEEDVREWGSANFDEMDLGPSSGRNGVVMIPPVSSDRGRTSPPLQFKSEQTVDSGDVISRKEQSGSVSERSSVSSGGNYSILMSRSPSSHVMSSPKSIGFQIQQSISLDLPSTDNFDHTNDHPVKSFTSTDSLSTMDNEDTLRGNRKSISIDAIRQAMSNYDNNIFAPVTDKREDILVKGTPRNQIARREKRDFTGETRHESPRTGAGGIGAALNQYNSGQKVTQESSKGKSKKIMGPTKPIFLGPNSLGKVAEYSVKEGQASDALVRRKSFLHPQGNHMENQQNNQGTYRSVDGSPRKQVKSKRNSTMGKLSKSQEKESSTNQRKTSNDKTKQKTAHFSHKNRKHRSSNKSSTKSPPRRKAWALNPFRQEDEKKVLEEKTHNSRRWSHVFPQGEIEFKRHAGPNWKSLCQPAILPITIDVPPSPEELEKFIPKEYDVKIFDKNENYSDFLEEMVRQRLIHDFQLVPQKILDQNIKTETARSQKSLDYVLRQKKKQIVGFPLIRPNEDTLQFVLSMGHRYQVLVLEPESKAEPESRTIKVAQYLGKIEQNIEKYEYLLFSSTTNSFARVSQVFRRYPDDYPWTRLDNSIRAVEFDILPENSNFRRIHFRIIPDAFDTASGEQEYINKISRLLEYIRKQVRGDCNIPIVSGIDRTVKQSRMTGQFSDRMMRLHVPFRKGRRDAYEWMELDIDSAVGTKRSLRIMFHWLYASAIQVENQVQVLQRRCTQYALNLVKVPQNSLDSDMMVNPFLRADTFSVDNKKHTEMMKHHMLQELEFVDDGERIVNTEDAKVAFNVEFKVVEFKIESERNSKTVLLSKRFPMQQYIHRSGTHFVRLLEDASGFTLFVFMENRQHIRANPKLARVPSEVFRNMRTFVQRLMDDQMPESTHCSDGH